jgi:hypothetical protein
MSRPNWRNGKAGKKVVSNTSTELALTTPLVDHHTKAVVAQPTATDTNKFPSPKDSTSNLFFEICLEFAGASSEVWPNDKVIAEKLELLKTQTSNKAVHGHAMAKEFQEKFQPHYSLIINKDPKFFELRALEFLQAKVKYDNAPPMVRSTVWDHLKNLVQYAGMVDMYAKCPQAMLDSISGIAGSLIDKIQSGEMTMGNVNPLQLGQMMMQQMNPQDLEQFGNAIMESGNMQNMMSVMQSTMSSGGFPAGAGMPDLSAFASLLPQQRK